MFLFSSACVDAIRVMTYMGAANEEYIKADTIAHELKIPLPYLAKTLKKLVDGDILFSKRGVGGGAKLRRAPSTVRLLEIILCIDGERPFDTCVMGLGDCSAETPCALHERWESQMTEFRELIAATTLSDISDDVKRRKILKL